jgi:SSS family transporter
MMYHAWSGKRKTKDATDYYVGGRSMGGIAIGISFFATYASTNTYLGFSGKAYEYGIAWLLIIPFAVCLSALAWAVVAPRLRTLTESMDSVTIPDFIGYRFASAPARVLASMLVIFSSLLYMTAVFKGIGNLLEAILDIPYASAIFMVLIIVMAYTSIGGFHSVVKTDVVQGVIMLIAACFMFVGVTKAAGGIGALGELRGASETANLFDWDTAKPLSVVIGITFATTIKFLVDPRQLSRFFALKDRHETLKGIAVSTASFAIVFSLLVPIGLYAHLILDGPVEDTDQVVPLLLSSGDVFSTWVTAFLFIAIISAAMSSLDSVLLVMACTCQRDLVGLVQPPRTESGELMQTRVLVAVFAIVTAVLALNPPGGIVAMTSFSGSLYGACFLPPILLGIYWRRGNGAAVIGSFIVGLTCLILWKPLGGVVVSLQGIHQVFPAIFLSVAVYTGIAAWGEARMSEGARKFFQA